MRVCYLQSVAALASRRLALASRHSMSTAAAQSAAAAEKTAARASQSSWPWWTKALAVPVAATVAATGYLFFFKSSEAVANDMCAVFERGGVEGWDAQYKADLQSLKREDVEKALAEFFEPESAATYGLIVGAGGCGKSTEVRKHVRSRIEAAKKAGAGGTAGIVYFTSPTDPVNLGALLATTLHFRAPTDLFGAVRRMVTLATKEQAVRVRAEEPWNTWGALQPLLQKAAELYSDKHGTSATLVIDDADIIAKKNAEFFLELQDFAKKAADGHSLRIVFVFSDGKTLPLLQRQSSITRAAPVLEVGELTDAAAISFLAGRNVEAGRAHELVTTVTGGRFAPMFSAIKYKHSVEKLREEEFIATATKLVVLGVSTTHSLFQALLSGAVPNDKALRLISSQDTLLKLLEANILMAHPNRTLTFGSRHVEAFFKEEARKARLCPWQR